MDFIKSEDSPLWGGSRSQERQGRRQTYYEILDVDFNASRARIREAYIRLKNTYSNNNLALYSLMTEDDAKESLHEIEEAFRVLEDEILRKQYNQQLTKDGLMAESVANLLPPLVPSRDPFGGFEQESLANQTERIVAVRHSTAEPMFSWNEASETAKSSLPPIKPPREGGLGQKNTSSASREEMREKIEAVLSQGEISDGRLYTKVRELLKISLDDVQNRTKISLEYVLAIESNLFHKLPALVYTRGFMKSYLQYLGVPDVSNRVNSFIEKMKAWQAEHQSDKL